jgi:hypothetical protein
MNPFDEQIQNLYDEYQEAESKLKMKRLYTKYDMDRMQEEVNKAHKDSFIFTLIGFGVGLIVAAVVFVLTRN